MNIKIKITKITLLNIHVRISNNCMWYILIHLLEQNL